MNLDFLIKICIKTLKAYKKNYGENITWSCAYGSSNMIRKSFCPHFYQYLCIKEQSDVMNDLPVTQECELPHDNLDPVREVREEDMKSKFGVSCWKGSFWTGNSVVSLHMLVPIWMQKMDRDVWMQAQPCILGSLSRSFPWRTSSIHEGMTTEW